MKKIISILSAALLVLLTCVPAYATEPVSEVPGNADLSVYARYVDNTDFSVIAIDDSGSGSITLPDGTEITVSGAADRLVIEEVTAREALDWAAQQLDGRAKDFSLFQVCRIDENGEAQPVNGVTVTIKPKNDTADSVYTVSDGKTGKLQCKTETGAVTFTTDGAAFYALCRDAKVTPDGKSPQTGDNSALALWTALLLVSGGAGILITTCGRKKRHSEC